MMNILMYPFLAFVALGLYLWHFKNANIQEVLQPLKMTNLKLIT